MFVTQVGKNVNNKRNFMLTTSVQETDQSWTNPVLNVTECDAFLRLTFVEETALPALLYSHTAWSRNVTMCLQCPP